MQAILDQLIQYDKELFLFLNNLGTETWDQFWVGVTNKETWIPLYLLLLVLSIWKLKKWQKTLAFIIFITALITIVDQSITVIFKPGLGRFRPCHDETLISQLRQVVNSCGGQYSFFSAHSANSFALAGFLTAIFRIKKIWVILFFLWAAMVAYSRIYVGVHYPIDIIVGAIWGLLIARGLYVIWRKLMVFLE